MYVCVCVGGYTQKNTAVCNFKFYFCNVYIAVEDVCPCGPVIKVGRVEVWRKVDETVASIFFFLLLPVSWGMKRREGERAIPGSPTALASGYEGWQLNVIVGSPMCSRFQGYCVKWF